MVQYFKKIGQAEKAKICLERAQVIQKELSEMWLTSLLYYQLKHTWW